MELVLVGAMGVDGVIGLSPGTGPGDASRADDTVSICTVTDGSTICCGSERIRLRIDAFSSPVIVAMVEIVRLAIRSPLQRHCLAISPNMRPTRVGKDRYGRSLAMVAGSQGALACWQLRHGQGDLQAGLGQRPAGRTRLFSVVSSRLPAGDLSCSVEPVGTRGAEPIWFAAARCLEGWAPSPASRRP